MIKLMAAIHRRPGLTHAEFCSYAVDVHAPKILAGPELPKRYVQNHVCDGSYGTVRKRDSVIELWFDDIEAFHRATGSNYYREVIEPDEHNLGDHSDAVLMLAREEIIEAPQPRHGGRKVLCFLKRDPRLSREAFTEAWQAMAPPVIPGGCGLVHTFPLTPEPVPAGGDVLGGGRLANEYDGIATHWVDAGATRALSHLRDAYTGTRQENGGELIDPTTSFFVEADEVVLI